MLVLKGLLSLHKTVQLQFLQRYWLGHRLDNCDIEWFALRANRDHSAKVGSQEILVVIGKFGLGVQNEAGQRLTVLPRECTGYSKHPLPTT